MSDSNPVEVLLPSRLAQAWHLDHAPGLQMRDWTKLEIVPFKSIAHARTSIRHGERLSLAALSSLEAAQVE